MGDGSVLKIIPVILSGGIGSRLWPLSRDHFPKQCHALIQSFTADEAENSGVRYGVEYCGV
ncbi:sugar phosphate nucleotidyltransferase [Marinomonas shanghaiensis]|uniref:sugar phosphate nucleotidyltransferase n=1 Tax=Marinomonas shanghaiensis TaxID=2202418 RepID=UPI003A937A10